MTTQTIPLNNPNARRTAIGWVQQAPDGYVCTIRKPKRTLSQNAKFHAICEDIERSGIEWAGRRRSAQQWKVLLVSGHAVATKEGAEIVPGLEGEFINIRESTASMDTARGSSLIEYSVSWCSLNGVRLSAPEWSASRSRWRHDAR